MSCHGALERTKMCACGRAPGSSSSVPNVNHTVSGNASWRNCRFDPQSPQKVREATGDER
jgi:hypothetical protein